MDAPLGIDAVFGRTSTVAEERTRQIASMIPSVVNERPTRIVVNLDHLAFNLRSIRSHVGVPVMGIVKANAYGHGLVPVAAHLQAQGVEQLGVAFLEEGIALRRAGITVPILVMGGIFGPQATQFIVHDLEITVSSLDKLRQVEAAAQALGRKAVIHLKIDTGMERIGVHSYSAGPFIEAAAASRWCMVKGVYSHLACADDPASPMTALQLERFLEACEHFTRIGAPMPLRHLANSGGVLHFAQTHLDMVRPGIVLYGVLPDPASQPTVAVKPVLSLLSQVIYFKVVKAGHPVSYGATWAPAHDTRVVTVPIGYGDGYPRGTVLARASADPRPRLSGGRPDLHGPVHGRHRQRQRLERGRSGVDRRAGRHRDRGRIARTGGRPDSL